MKSILFSSSKNENKLKPFYLFAKIDSISDLIEEMKKGKANTKVRKTSKINKRG